MKIKFFVLLFLGFGILPYTCPAADKDPYYGLIYLAANSGNYRHNYALGYQRAWGDRGSWQVDGRIGSSSFARFNQTYGLGVEARYHLSQRKLAGFYGGAGLEITYEGFTSYIYDSSWNAREEVTYALGFFPGVRLGYQWVMWQKFAMGINLGMNYSKDVSSGSIISINRYAITSALNLGWTI